MGGRGEKGGEIGYEHCIIGARGHLYIYLHIDSSMGLPYSRTCIPCFERQVQVQTRKTRALVGLRVVECAVTLSATLLDVMLAGYAGQNRSIVARPLPRLLSSVVIHDRSSSVTSTCLSNWQRGLLRSHRLPKGTMSRNCRQGRVQCVSPFVSEITDGQSTLRVCCYRRNVESKLI